MSHVRKIVFDLLDKGLTDQEILSDVLKVNRVKLTLARIATMREAYEKLSSDGRMAYIQGKLDLLGNPY